METFGTALYLITAYKSLIKLLSISRRGIGGYLHTTKARIILIKPLEIIAENKSNTLFILMKNRYRKPFLYKNIILQQ